MASDNIDGGEANLPDLGDAIDVVTFGQILEMDDDENDREFSKSLVVGFFDQAQETFDHMDQALESKDLEELSKLGHFLKGSSATLGLTKVKDSCEKIQQYGKKKDESGAPLTDEKVCLDKITSVLEVCKKEYKEAETALNGFYGNS